MTFWPRAPRETRTASRWHGWRSLGKSCVSQSFVWWVCKIICFSFSMVMFLGKQDCWITLDHVSLFFVVWHAEVPVQHEANCQRSWFGQTEKIHRWLWTGGLNVASFFFYQNKYYDCIKVFILPFMLCWLIRSVPHDCSTHRITRTDIPI